MGPVTLTQAYRMGRRLDALPWYVSNLKSENYSMKIHKWIRWRWTTACGVKTFVNSHDGWRWVNCKSCIKNK